MRSSYPHPINHQPNTGFQPTLFASRSLPLALRGERSERGLRAWVASRVGRRSSGVGAEVRLESCMLCGNSFCSRVILSESPLRIARSAQDDSVRYETSHVPRQPLLWSL